MKQGPFPGLVTSFTMLLGLLCLVKFISELASPFIPQYHHYFEKKWVLAAYFVPLLLIREVSVGVRATLVLVASGLIAAICAVPQYYSTTHDNWILGRALDNAGGGHSRAVGFYSNALTYGGVALLIFALAVAYLLFSKTNQSKKLGLPAVIISGIGLLAAASKSPIVGAAAAGCLLLVYIPGRWKLISAGIAATFSVIGLSVFSSIRDRFAFLLTTDQGGESSRLALWAAALTLFKQHPWLGVGEGNWKRAFLALHIPNPPAQIAHAHSDPLSILSDSGVSGMVIFLAMWAVYFVLAASLVRPLRPTHPVRWIIIGSMAGVAGILVAGNFQNYQSDAEVANVLWFLVGVSLTLGFRSIRDEANA